MIPISMKRQSEMKTTDLRGKSMAADNTEFCNIGAEGITMNICNSIWHLFGQTSFNLAFCSYLQH
jgi:hypothetical protein